MKKIPAILKSFSTRFLANRLAIIFALFGFSISQGKADFGPQKIVTSTATDVIDAFPADMDGDGDIDFLACKPGNFLVEARRFFIVTTVMVDLQS